MTPVTKTLLLQRQIRKLVSQNYSEAVVRQKIKMDPNFEYLTLDELNRALNCHFNPRRWSPMQKLRASRIPAIAAATTTALLIGAVGVGIWASAKNEY